MLSYFSFQKIFVISRAADTTCASLPTIHQTTNPTHKLARTHFYSTSPSLATAQNKSRGGTPVEPE
jgi:hypothetical protein